MPLIPALILGGLCATFFGILFGLPSLRVKGLYLAVATLAAQFFSDWMFLRIKWFTNNSDSGSVSVNSLQVLGHADRKRHQQVPLLPGHAGGGGPAGQEPGARRHRPRVDGDPRHGRGCGRDRHPPHVRQAQRVCRQLLHRGHGRCAVGLCAPGRVGACGLLGGNLVPPVVHGDHRRSGLHHGRLLWCGLHRGAAHRAQPVPAGAAWAPSASRSPRPASRTPS